MARRSSDRRIDGERRVGRTERRRTERDRRISRRVDAPGTLFHPTQRSLPFLRGLRSVPQAPPADVVASRARPDVAGSSGAQEKRGDAVSLIQPLADALERERAATTFDRNVVVTAGAGTGKTRLLVD